MTKSVLLGSFRLPHGQRTIKLRIERLSIPTCKDLGNPEVGIPLSSIEFPYKEFLLIGDWNCLNRSFPKVKNPGTLMTWKMTQI